MTIFKKIIDKQIPAKFLFEDELCIAINDVAPKAPVHILVMNLVIAWFSILMPTLARLSFTFISTSWAEKGSNKKKPCLKTDTA